MAEICYKSSSRSTYLHQMEHQIFTQMSLWTSVLKQNIRSILEITGCDRCSVAIENQILFTKVIKYICGWLVLLKTSALKPMKLIFLYSLFGMTRLFMFAYVKQSLIFLAEHGFLKITCSTPIKILRRKLSILTRDPSLDIICKDSDSIFLKYIVISYLFMS